MGINCRFFFAPLVWQSGIPDYDWQYNCHDMLPDGGPRSLYLALAGRVSKAKAEAWATAWDPSPGPYTQELGGNWLIEFPCDIYLLNPFFVSPRF